MMSIDARDTRHAADSRRENNAVQTLLGAVEVVRTAIGVVLVASSVDIVVAIPAR